MHLIFPIFLASLWGLDLLVNALPVADLPAADAAAPMMGRGPIPVRLPRHYPIPDTTERSFSSEMLIFYLVCDVCIYTTAEQKFACTYLGQPNIYSLEGHHSHIIMPLSLLALDGCRTEIEKGVLLIGRMNAGKWVLNHQYDADGSSLIYCDAPYASHAMSEKWLHC